MKSPILCNTNLTQTFSENRREGDTAQLIAQDQYTLIPKSEYEDFKLYPNEVVK